MVCFALGIYNDYEIEQFIYHPYLFLLIKHAQIMQRLLLLILAIIGGVMTVHLESEAQVSAESKIVLLFTAEWCGQICDDLETELTDLEEEANGEWKLLVIDFDHNVKLVGDYKIWSIPTVIFLKDNTTVQRFDVNPTKEEVTDASVRLL